MHFKRVANTINRPHFLAERGDEVLLLNFCQDHKTMKCRTLEFTPEELNPDFGFGRSVFGSDDRPRHPQLTRGPRAKTTIDFELNGNSRHGLGATDGKVYFLDDSQRTEFMKMWRIDCETGDNEYTRVPSGFITRFTDSEYFVFGGGARSPTSTIYQWKTGENAEMIRTVKIPNNVADRTRIAFGSKLIFIKAEADKILVTSLDVITDDVANKTIALTYIGDPTMRWFCAKNHLLAVISGRVIFINIHSLAYEISPTNLDVSGKYHPFAVDSKGFVYILCPTKEGCSVQRARDANLSLEEEATVVIPKKEKVSAPKFPPKTTDQMISVHFHVTYRDETLFNKKMKMLATKPIGDVIRRSPEIQQPPETRLKLFYRNEEVLTFRTPNFLRMPDGESVHAEFVDKDLGEANTVRGEDEPVEPGFFSRSMLDEIKNETTETKKLPKKKEMKKQASDRARSDSGESRGANEGGGRGRGQQQQLSKTTKDTMHGEKSSSVFGPRSLQIGASSSTQQEEERPTFPEIPTNIPMGEHLEGGQPSTSVVNPFAVPSDYMQQLMNAPLQEVQRILFDQPMFAPAQPLFLTPPDTVRTEDAAAREAHLKQQEKEKADERRQEKLLEEMQWLRNFVSGNIGHNKEDGQPVNELEQLQKKYARVLMMMGRTEIKK